MSHAFIALSSAALTSFVLFPQDDGFRFGVFVLAVAAGIAGIVCAAFKL